MKTKTACKKMRFPPMASRLYPPEGCKNSPQGPVFASFKPEVITAAQPGGPKVGNVHSIPCNFNRKWVGILCNRAAKGAVRSPLS